MAAIWQRDNKNSNHSLIEKNTEIIVFEPLCFIWPLSANQLPSKQYIFVGMYLKYKTPCTLHKNAKNRWNHKYSIFFAGSV